MTIDSHVHFWAYDKQRDSWITPAMKVLRQDYLPEHIEPVLKRNLVEGCIAVQADQSELETHFLVELSRSHSVIKGVVGWVDLCGADIESRLQYFSQYPVIKGWRHIVQAEPDGFLAREDFRRGVAALQDYDYSYDLLIYHHQLPQAVDFVSRFPEQRMVIDHCAKPDLRKRELENWKAAIKQLAAQPQVFCKLSGLLTEAVWKEWSPAEFYPCLDIVFEAFGVQRLLFGSDWPVILLSGMYVQWKSLLLKYMEALPEAERELVLGGNASRFYGLEEKMDIR